MHEKASKPKVDWPGNPFPMNNDIGLAGLGTSEGAAVFWFLAQHKAAFDLHEVLTVNIFYSGEKVNALFAIERL